MGWPPEAGIFQICQPVRRFEAAGFLLRHRPQLHASEHRGQDLQVVSLRVQRAAFQGFGRLLVEREVCRNGEAGSAQNNGKETLLVRGSQPQCDAGTHRVAEVGFRLAEVVQQSDDILGHSRAKGAGRRCRRTGPGCPVQEGGGQR